MFYRTSEGSLICDTYVDGTGEVHVVKHSAQRIASELSPIKLNKVYSLRDNANFPDVEFCGLMMNHGYAPLLAAGQGEFSVEMKLPTDFANKAVDVVLNVVSREPPYGIDEHVCICPICINGNNDCIVPLKYGAVTPLIANSVMCNDDGTLKVLFKRSELRAWVWILSLSVSSNGNL